MQVIPVVDLKNGVAVHAVAGRRDDYLPVRSSLCTGAQPERIARAMLDATGSVRLYVADLAAIMHDDLERHDAILRSLCTVAADAKASLWIDAGWRDAGRSAWRRQLQSWAVHCGTTIDWIVGSESLEASVPLPADAVLSLDYADGRLLGPAGLDESPELWPQRIIIMELNRVGSGAGPALEALARLRGRLTTARAKQPVQWYLGGGIRHDTDLAAAEKAGASGVLVASALHAGLLTGPWQAQKKGPSGYFGGSPSPSGRRPG